MPFDYCSFISYRHTLGYKGLAYTEEFVEDLKAELELRVTQQVFRDVERLKGAQYYNEALATALCQSVCMVVLYWPTYFSEEHAFCAREFKAMETLEARRLQLLPAQERTNGLIIILAFRDFASIPAAIRRNRLCKDFEAYTLKPGMRDDPRFRQDMIDLGQYIAGRVRAFAQVQPDPAMNCHRFRLPAEEDVLPWVRELACPRPVLPTRQGDQ